MKEGLSFSVFVPTWNRRESLRLLLESLCAQTYNNLEVILVDGGSTDGTEEMVKEFDEKLSIIFFRQTREGIIGAANEALEKAAGDIFIRTDDDVVVSRQWLAELAETYKDAEAGGVTGPTLIPQESLGSRDLTAFNEKLKNNPSLPWRLFARFYYGYILEGKPFDVSTFTRAGAFTIGSNYPVCLELDGLKEVDNLEACNWSCRTELLRKCKGFDEEFLKGLGDYHEADASYRIRELGYKIFFNPKAVVNHNIGGGSVPKVRPRSYWRSQNFVLFYYRHIRPDTLDKICRFGSYLIFQNIYWLYKFLTTGNLSAFMGIPGTLVGLVRHLPELKRREAALRG
jgi:GT2 family glycosyltransferase